MARDTYFFGSNPLAAEKRRIKCPFCGSENVKVVGDNFCWECQECGRKYYPTEEDKRELRS